LGRFNGFNDGAVVVCLVQYSGHFVDWYA